MPLMKTDPSGLEEFRARYEAGWPDARPMIERHDYASAFKTYPWPTFTAVPWTPVRKPLSESRIGVVTTGGLYRAGVDAAFAGDAAEGDWSFRAIPSDVPIQTLAIAHEHFAHEVAEADMNTIFPSIGSASSRSPGSSGGWLMSTSTAASWAIARALRMSRRVRRQPSRQRSRRRGPTWPSSSPCDPSATSPADWSSARSRHGASRPYRCRTIRRRPSGSGRLWAHVRFPRGSMLGEPGNRDKQRNVLSDTLRALAAIDLPGGSVELPYRWEANPVTWRGKPLREGSSS